MVNDDQSVSRKYRSGRFVFTPENFGIPSLFSKSLKPKNGRILYTTKPATDSIWRPVSSIFKTKKSDSDGFPWYRVGKMISKRLGDFLTSDSSVENRQGLDDIGNTITTVSQSLLSNPGVSVNSHRVDNVQVELLDFSAQVTSNTSTNFPF